MSRLKVGVMIESFRLGVKKGIEKAAELKLDGFQVYCTRGEMHPDNLSRSGRKDFTRFVQSRELVLSALCADFGHGFVDPDKNEELIAETRKCVDLARDLGVNIITTHIGVIPEEEKEARWRVMSEALTDLGRYAENKDVVLATETGPESPELMARFLKSLKASSLRVNYDPANLTMKGFDAVAGVKTLADFIVHTHAKDGLGGGREMPLGEGDVDWPNYLSALAEIGFQGFFTIEREAGADPVGDIVKARDFLRRL